MQGLANLNNTCYINTLIQCLGHVNCLRKWILASDCHPDGPFTSELQHILKLMWNEEKSLAPHRFVDCLLRVFKLETGEQHDLCEVFLRVIDRLSWEDRTTMISIDDHVSTREREENGGAMDVLHKMARKAWNQYHPRGFRTFDAMMEGLQVHQVQCKQCKRCFHNFEPFMVLNIDISDAGMVASIDQGVRAYFGSESLGEWSCDHCKQVRPAEKTVRIWQFPNVLTVVLKRFAITEGGFGRKVRTPVVIPQELHFDQESSIRGVTSGKMTFSLRSVGLHHGALNHGHYTCVAKHKNKWIHYDDIHVAEVTDMDAFCAHNPLAYLLIYERQQP